MRPLFRRLWYLLRERRAQADLREELAFHRDMKARELEAGGIEAVEARRAARRALGNTTLARDQVRDVWVPHWLQGMSQDFRLGLRTLAATPGVSAAAILSLALGIGANTAIFSLIDGLLLRALPVRDPGRLVMLTTGREGDYWDYPVWGQIHSRSAPFDGSLAWAGARFDLAPRGESEYVDGIWVSGSYFGVLGVPAFLGRTISEADDVAGGGSNGPVAVVSYDFWERHFAGDPGVIGRGLTLDRVAFTIVGVAPRGFFGTDVGHAFAVAVPLSDKVLMTHAADAGGSRSVPTTVSIMARLPSDQTIGSATVMLRGMQPAIRDATLPAGWPQAFLDQYLRQPFTIEPGAMGVSVLRERFSRPLLVVFVIVALVLLIACANLANLSLARASARRRELGMRLALGASTWRLMRQLMAESVLLAAVGAAGGLVVASWSAGFLTRQLSTTVAFAGPHAMTGAVFLDTSVDGRVLAFTLGVTIITLLVFGTVPAWRASRVAPLDAVAEHDRTGWMHAGWPAADGFVAIQLAVCLILIASASLFVRTLAALETRPLGFDRHGLLVATIDAQHASLSADRRQALYAQALDAVRRLPDVAEAALSSQPAIVNGATLGQPIQAVSGAAPLPSRGANVGLNLISAGWFQTMKIPLMAGRDLRPGDTLGSPQVMVVNQAFARKFLGGENAVGHTVSLFLPGQPPPPLEIVGVVGDSVHEGMRGRVEPTIFLPIAQRSGVWLPFLASVDLTVRPRSDGVANLPRNVAAGIESVNAEVSLTLHPFTDYVADALVQERLVALLAAGFAVLALALAAIGLYGVTSYSIARRRTEIGIRIALGASAASIVRLTVSRLSAVILVGVTMGGAVTLLASRYLASLLYGAQPRDPASLAGSVAVLVVAATLAAWAPVRGAVRTDPASTIRCN